jgi:uncharacterized protein (TIGR03118 family)
MSAETDPPRRTKMISQKTNLVTFEPLEARRLFAATLPTFVQTNLVSDQPGVAAHTDPNLVDAWGVVETKVGTVWVSNNVTGTSTVYDSSGNTIPADASGTPLVVTIPGPTGSGTAALTGVALNTSKNFVVSSTSGSGPAEFLYASEDGTIAGWGTGLNSTEGVLAVNNNAAGAVYKGLTLAGSGKVQELFAANFGQGQVDVFDGKFSPVSLRAGAFTDSSIPAGFAPFNIQNIGGRLYVTYAQQDTAHVNDVPGAGRGFVDIFNTKGTLLRRFAAGGALNAPWGVTPILGGHFAGDILVGNFGDGSVNVFSPRGQFLGAAQGADGQTLVIPGLWDLTYGAGKDRNTLFFSAGPNSESDGVFGTLTIQPLPRPHPLAPTPAPIPKPIPLPKPAPTPTPIFGGYIARAVVPSMNNMTGTGTLNNMWMA